MVRHYFLTLYDHLGQAVWLNLIWAVATIPWIVAGSAVAWAAAAAADALGHPFLVGIGWVGAVGLVAFSPPTLLLCVATRDWVRGGDGGVRGAWVLTRRLAWRAQAGGLVTTMVLTLLLGNALFYQTWAGWVGVALSGIMLWLVVGVALAAMLLFPVLVDSPHLPLHRVLRQCVLLVLGNGRRCVVLGLASTVCLLAGAASGAGLALGAVSAAMLVTNLGLMVMMRRYGGAPVEPDSRGLRDLLRPWQA
jgi:uncharacterized membrane protein YesL